MCCGSCATSSPISSSWRLPGSTYPEREERFEVVYHLLSVTKNLRLRVKVRTDEDHAVPTVHASLAGRGLAEREVFDMYGVLFEGNTDLRRILTDYGFRGHPFRKDFPLTGYVELRLLGRSQARVYEPVKLAQDFRTFDFMSPVGSAEYILPGDERPADRRPARRRPHRRPPPPPSPAAKGPPSGGPAQDDGQARRQPVPARPANTIAAKRSPAKKADAEGVAPAKPRAPRKPKTPSGGDA